MECLCNRDESCSICATNELMQNEKTMPLPFEFGQTVYFFRYEKIVSGKYCGLDSYGHEAIVSLENGQLYKIEMNYKHIPIFATPHEARYSNWNAEIKQIQSEISYLEKRINSDQEELNTFKKQLAELLTNEF